MGEGNLSDGIFSRQPEKNHLKDEPLTSWVRLAPARAKFVFLMINM